MPHAKYNDKVSQKFKDLSPKDKAIVALRALKDEYGFTNDVIAKALNYHPVSVSAIGVRLKAADFVDSSDIKEAFKTIKLFSKGEQVGDVKPPARTVLSAATELIKIGTDHNDHVDNVGNLTLNINVLKGVDPKQIAMDSLDDRMVIDSNETVVVEDICADNKACVTDDLYAGVDTIEEEVPESDAIRGEAGLQPIE